MTDPLNFDAALGWMAVGWINDHFPHPEDKITDPEELDNLKLGMGACCVTNCGPCAALKWFADNDRLGFEYRLISTGFTENGWCYWNSDEDTLDWDWFEAYWAQHTTCGMSNGVPTGCDFDDDDRLNTNPKETP